MAETKPAKPKPHYHAHRDRLRSRFAQSGGEALQDYELLELFLFNSIPRRDVKPVAKALIARFGNFAEVCAAPLHLLVETDGIGEKTALDLRLLHAASLRMGRESLLNRPVLGSWSALLDYCRASMQYEPIEQFRVLFLDKKNRLIADEIMSKGTIDRAPVYPREIAKRALNLESTAIILAHNHPSGDPTPSHADIELTKSIQTAVKSIGVVVHDHLVVGRQDVVSFKMLGLM